MTPESALLRSIRLALAARGDCVLWRNNVGVARYGTGGHRVRYGLCPGSSDLIGIVECDYAVGHLTTAQVPIRGRIGRFFALEIKAGRRAETPEQSMFRAVVTRHGGYAAVVRSVVEAMAAVDAARRGEP